MKGKRKANTTKWVLKQKFEKEARTLLANRSAKAGRFLDTISMTAIVNEPAGLLAGSSPGPWLAP